MRTKAYIAVALVLAAIGAIAFFGFNSNPNRQSPPENHGPTTANPPPPFMVSGPITASSYGKDATGTKNTTSVTPSAPVSTAQLGVITGIAKPVPGKKPDFASMKIGLYDPKTNKQLTSTSLAADGSYRFIVEPGEYTLNIASGTGVSAQLPQRVYAGKGELLTINFFVR